MIKSIKDYHKNSIFHLIITWQDFFMYCNCSFF